VTSSFAVFEAAIRVKSTHLIKSCLKTSHVIASSGISSP